MTQASAAATPVGPPLPRTTPTGAAPAPAALPPLPRTTPTGTAPAPAAPAPATEAPAAEQPEDVEEVPEVDAVEASEEPSEETAAPMVAPPVPPRRAATLDREKRDSQLEETTDPEIAPPKADEVGILDPLEAIRAAAEAVEDVFAPPAMPTRGAAGAEGEEKEEPPREESIDLDAMPSVISIPEDDIPRAPAPEPAEAPVLPALEAAPPAGPAAEAEGKAEHAEEIVDVDVQPDEADEKTAPKPPPAAAPAPPRPSAVPARPLRKRRRKHGERRAWWEEIFDEEYIRSLPRYSAEQTRNDADFIEHTLGVAKTARILDIGCGDGRLAVELAHRGYEVVGLDLSVPMLARAGEAAQAKGVKINFIQGDMRDLRFEGAFDAVYCVGTTFGYFDDDTNQAVMAGIFRALKPGGRLLLGLTNRDYVTHNQPRSTWFQGDDRQYLEDTDFNFITSRLVVKRSWATSAGDQETVEYSIRLYSLHELGKALHAAGFRVIQVSGHPATVGVFFGANSASLLLLAERP